MSRNVVRAGVAGVGSLGQWHASKYAELPDVELAAIFDTDPDRAAEIAEKYGASAIASSLEDLAERCDAISVVVPTDLHRQVAGELLEHGVHLLVEKPIAATTQEAHELVALAEQKEVLLQVGHIERFNPVLAVVEDLPSPPTFIEASRLAKYPPIVQGQRPRGTEVSVVLDLMIHDIEVILHLVKSPVVDVRAVGLKVLSPDEDIANVRLAFENGCIANITASRISQEAMRKVRLFYPDAYVSLDYGEQSGYVQKLGPRGIVREEIPIEREDALYRELREFTDCVRSVGTANPATPRVSGRHGSEALVLADRIIQQSRERPS